ncbi:hypothetical protein [Metabacillus fastidiosus]|uniref:Uncharacterized protein n=1 Tax=Metabacillus fastidiosus TaxID=1458 RepID=A0ABU6NZJ8_9BACI|nr:hypothetical protein [Metabacillus fastidiosus]MED4402545.1 hypothetical protein [Metabacillus fastidiosus]MED4461903.1 hypothetical protein [Metabacillus fastidiosus]
MIDDIRTDLKNVINLYKEKPYLPLWGEILYVLRRLKKEINEETTSNIFLYEAEHSVHIFYIPKDGRIFIKLPDFNILLKQDKFIDNILKGRFWPK